MDDLTEALAKVIADSGGRDAYAWANELDADSKEYYRLFAQTAIRAVLDGIREPTIAMIRRGQERAAAWQLSHEDDEVPPGAVYTAMIDKLRESHD